MLGKPSRAAAPGPRQAQQPPHPISSHRLPGKVPRPTHSANNTTRDTSVLGQFKTLPFFSGTQEGSTLAASTHLTRSCSAKTSGEIQRQKVSSFPGIFHYWHQPEGQLSFIGPLPCGTSLSASLASLTAGEEHISNKSQATHFTPTHRKTSGLGCLMSRHSHRAKDCAHADSLLRTPRP